MATLLGIGNAVLDVVNRVHHYPLEDSEVRATSQLVQRGGNVANLLTVARQLGVRCQWLGTLGDDPGAALLRAALSRGGVDYSRAQVIAGGRTPTSYITLNAQNGSRTIVHFRDLPELTVEHFLTQDLSAVDWLHVEARNAVEQAQMLAATRERWPQLPISLEIEKDRPHVAALLPHAQALFVSSHFAREQGVGSARALGRLLGIGSTQLLVYTKGADGAEALRGNELTTIPAVPPAQLLDTLAAGDTFIGAALAYRLTGRAWLDALRGAAEVAGRKCGQYGIEGLFSA